MNRPSQKSVGWIIVCLGLLVTGITIYFSWLFFTAKADFPQVFKFEEKQTASETLTLDPFGSMDQAAVQALTKQAVAEAIPKDAIAKLLNIASWSAFSFFLIVAASYISGIGIKLLAIKEKE